MGVWRALLTLWRANKGRGSQRGVRSLERGPRIDCVASERDWFGARHHSILAREIYKGRGREWRASRIRVVVRVVYSSRVSFE